MRSMVIECNGRTLAGVVGFNFRSIQGGCSTVLAAPDICTELVDDIVEIGRDGFDGGAGVDGDGIGVAFFSSFSS